MRVLVDGRPRESHPVSISHPDFFRPKRGLIPANHESTYENCFNIDSYQRSLRMRYGLCWQPCHPWPHHKERHLCATKPRDQPQPHQNRQLHPQRQCESLHRQGWHERLNRNWNPTLRDVADTTSVTHGHGARRIPWRRCKPPAWGQETPAPPVASFPQTNVRSRGRWALSARSFMGKSMFEFTLSVKLTVKQAIALGRAVVAILLLVM